jgi:hypothetical protein
MVKSIDDRISVDEARVYGWELALDEDMTLEFAVKALGRHYSVSTEKIMPSHLNLPWRAYKRDERLKQDSLERSQITGTPPTEEFKAMMKEMRKKIGKSTTN